MPADKNIKSALIIDKHKIIPYNIVNVVIHGGKIMPICKFCAGEATLVSDENGIKKYHCPYCNANYEEVSGTSQKSTQNNDSLKTNPALNGEDVYNNMIGSIVEIFAIVDENCCSSGSGFFLSKSGFVATNAHVVCHEGKPINNILVKFKNIEPMAAYLLALGSPNDIDLALLFVPEMANTATPVTLADSTKVKNGEKIYCMGNSRGEGTCITSGIISDNSRELNNQVYIMSDVASNPGNSGGPIINEHCEVIGVSVAQRVDSDGMKYAIPANTLRDFISYVEQETELKINAKSSARTETTGLFSVVMEGIHLLLNAISWTVNFCKQLKAK